MKVVALAGGVGGARLADGLYRSMVPEDLTIIVNTGDDFEHFGLRICPDLDTVCYTLAGLSNPETGWGRINESWQAIQGVETLGGPTWFRLGDQDLGTHLERTRRLLDGQTLTEITLDFCQRWGILAKILPMSDDPVRTVVISDEGPLMFQDYFVRRQCQPKVLSFYFDGVRDARLTSEVQEALGQANLVIICPSNPWLSIDPILSVSGIRQAIGNQKEVVGVSPIIAGRAVKGPAAKIFRELGIEPSAVEVARHYGSQASGGLLSGFVLDKADAELEEEISVSGMRTLVTDTLMNSDDKRKHLASKVLGFAIRRP